MNVLLIHNSELTFDAVERLFSENGIDASIVSAKMCDLAIETAKCAAFDLLICPVDDYPQDVAIDFLRRLDEAGSRAYRLAVVRKDMLKAMGSGFLNLIDDFLSSPADTEELIFRIAKAARGTQR
jgi:DNA-binding response OmpR family regulator